jgi:hypothetical protein
MAAAVYFLYTCCAHGRMKEVQKKVHDINDYSVNNKHLLLHFAARRVAQRSMSNALTVLTNKPIRSNVCIYSVSVIYYYSM